MFLIAAKRHASIRAVAKDRAAADGVVSPIRLGFEEDGPEVDSLGCRARNHSAAVKFVLKLPAADEKRLAIFRRSIWSRRPP
jgi:hypothetical protein